MDHKDAALEAASHGGVFAAIASLSEIGDLETAADAYARALKDAYWVEKDLHLATGIGYAGVSRLLAAAADASEEAAFGLRSSAKAILYNLASFTWIGWGEPGVTVTENEAAAGLAAARMNTALAVQLDKGPLAESRGHWMIAAHLLTSGAATDAIAEFERAAALAEEAGADSEVDLSDAFAGLAVLTVSGDAGRMDAALVRLRHHEHGDDLCAQVETAQQVLDG